MQLSWAKPGNPMEGGKPGRIGERREGGGEREERGRGRGSRAKPGNQLVDNMYIRSDFSQINVVSYQFQSHVTIHPILS